MDPPGYAQHLCLYCTWEYVSSEFDGEMGTYYFMSILTRIQERNGVELDCSFVGSESGKCSLGIAHAHMKGTVSSITGKSLHAVVPARVPEPMQ